MMPLSSQLQQHWQTVADRLPADFPIAELSPQARSVMAFSDFVEQSVIAQPGWLKSLRTPAGGGRVAALRGLAAGSPAGGG
jgi:glutamate-ammonia-ligase adenylyltransferase